MNISDSMVIKDPDILGGIPVFRGTRVPVKNPLDYLATGETIDAFLDDFPTVTREQVIQFLRGLDLEAYRHMPWEQFIDLTYGSMADDPIERGEQPPIDVRDELE